MVWSPVLKMNLTFLLMKLAFLFIVFFIICSWLWEHPFISQNIFLCKIKEHLQHFVSQKSTKAKGTRCCRNKSSTHLEISQPLLCLCTDILHCSFLSVYRDTDFNFHCILFLSISWLVYVCLHLKGLDSSLCKFLNFLVSPFPSNSTL